MKNLQQRNVISSKLFSSIQFDMEYDENCHGIAKPSSILLIQQYSNSFLMDIIEPVRDLIVHTTKAFNGCMQLHYLFLEIDDISKRNFNLKGRAHKKNCLLVIYPFFAKSLLPLENLIVEFSDLCTEWSVNVIKLVHFVVRKSNNRRDQKKKA